MDGTLHDTWTFYTLWQKIWGDSGGSPWHRQKNRDTHLFLKFQLIYLYHDHITKIHSLSSLCLFVFVYAFCNTSRDTTAGRVWLTTTSTSQLPPSQQDFLTWLWVVEMVRFVRQPIPRERRVRETAGAALWRPEAWPSWSEDLQGLTQLNYQTKFNLILGLH